jgi:hypothetical protein
MSPLIELLPAVLISLAKEESPESAVSWLERILATKRADVLRIYPIWGLPDTETIELADGVWVTRWASVASLS